MFSSARPFCSPLVIVVGFASLARVYKPVNSRFLRHSFNVVPFASCVRFFSLSRASSRGFLRFVSVRLCVWAFAAASFHVRALLFLRFLVRCASLCYASPVDSHRFVVVVFSSSEIVGGCVARFSFLSRSSSSSVASELLFLGCFRRQASACSFKGLANVSIFSVRIERIVLSCPFFFYFVRCVSWPIVFSRVRVTFLSSRGEILWARSK